MSRIAALFVAVAIGAVAAAGECLAQPGAKAPRVGVLSFGRSGDDTSAGGKPLRQGLERSGWVIGRNLVLEPRHAEGSMQRLNELAQELVRVPVDAIYADGPEAAEAAARTTQRIPIVFWGHAFPVEAGLVASLGRPGRNVTGVTPWTGPELAGKLLELLREIAPKTHRLGVLSGPEVAPTRPVVATRSLRYAMPTLEQSAERLGVDVRMFQFERYDQSAQAFGRIREWGADAIVVGGDQTTRQHCREIVEFASRNRLPAAFAFKDCIDAGGLLAYADDVPESIRRSVALLDRILRGARPAELPVEQPTRFELVVNLKTARSLALTVPKSVLVRADRVIE